MIIIGIIVARLDSSRLPKKALIKINGIPLIGYVINRARLITGSTNLILTTTERTVDDPLVEYAKGEKIQYFRGDFTDVAKRVLDCAEYYQSDYFIRINGDSPFLDVDLVKSSMQYCNEGYDLISNITERSFPYGISVEICKTLTFKKIFSKIKDPQDKEHVTRFFYKHLSQFKVKSVICPERNLESIRLTVDDYKDLEIFSKIVNVLKEKTFTANYVDIAKIYQSTINKKNDFD